ncbi:arylamine N-acetyltransferase [Nonomuraea sp. NPDC050310]|uniref:arylamine N-acetyltransferase family protein n=1 Tax=unclassified Nonomuraea TaxID=2593643 RepID=UPI00340CA1C1
MDERSVSRYLDRIGAARPAAPDAEGLRALQLAHLRTVPFENLSIHLGEPIVLEPGALYAKVVERRRGGFCYELNGLFAELLTALGYRVTPLAARVFAGPGLTPPLDHLALRVDLDEPWLVDVGFGEFVDAPLRLDERGEQEDANGLCRIVPDGFGDLDVHRNGRPEYRLDCRPYTLEDFVPAAWWHSTSPGSHFARSPVCSLRTPEGRLTLSGDKLITTAYGKRTETVLAADEVLPAYREHFGLTLDRAPLG